MLYVLGAVSGTAIAGYVLSAIAGGGSVAALFDRRRKMVSDTWEDLAAARAAKVEDQDRRLSDLEAEVRLLRSDFVAKLVVEVSKGVLAELATRREIHDDR